IPSSAKLDGARLPQPHLLQRSRQGRPLRGVGAASALQRRGPSGLPVTALIACVGRTHERWAPFGRLANFARASEAAPEWVLNIGTLPALLALGPGWLGP